MECMPIRSQQSRKAWPLLAVVHPMSHSEELGVEDHWENPGVARCLHLLTIAQRLTQMAHDPPQDSLCLRSPQVQTFWQSIVSTTPNRHGGVTWPLAQVLKALGKGTATLSWHRWHPPKCGIRAIPSVKKLQPLMTRVRAHKQHPHTHHVIPPKPWICNQLDNF